MVISAPRQYGSLSRVSGTVTGVVVKEEPATDVDFCCVHRAASFKATTTTIKAR